MTNDAALMRQLQEELIGRLFEIDRANGRDDQTLRHKGSGPAQRSNTEQALTDEEDFGRRNGLTLTKAHDAYSAAPAGCDAACPAGHDDARRTA